MRGSSVLIVDDESAAISATRFMLEAAGIDEIVTLKDSRQVMALLAGRDVGVLLMDLSMPHLTGEELLKQVQAAHPQLPVIVVTGSNEVETAVRCLQGGAFDYLVKPAEPARLATSVKRALELREVQQEYADFRQRVLSDEIEHPDAFAEIVTQNATMRAMFQYLETLAPTSRPILVTGETGTGKELVARAIHRLSRLRGRFVTVNVAGLDDHVFSDTLFGHVRGAFTGADKSRDGLIKSADGGTLLLDEIGDLGPGSQVKLLRLLQEREYMPLGSDAAQLSRARIVAATNRDLLALQREGRFRPDLYYRLQGQHVQVPPLARRLDDLPLLVELFLERASADLERRKPSIPAGLFGLLASYRFPGNVRELEAMVFQAASQAASDALPLELFERYLKERSVDVGAVADPPPKDASPLQQFETLPTLKELQQLLMQEALRRTGGNQTQASRLLGISQPGLSKALKRDRQ